MVPGEWRFVHCPLCGQDSASQEDARVEGRIFGPTIYAFGPNQHADVVFLKMPQVDVAEAGNNALSELSVPLCRGDGDGVLRSSSVITVARSSSRGSPDRCQDKNRSSWLTSTASI